METRITVKQRILTAVVVAVVVGWAAVAVAGERGWFETLDAVERQADVSSERAVDIRRRADELDTYLDEEIASPETARRATEQLRRDVSVRVAEWDVAVRRAGRLSATGGADDSRAMGRALELADAPADDEWRNQVEVLREVDEGIEYTEALLTRRGQLDIDYAYRRAVEAKSQREMEFVANEAAEHDDELQAEIERLAAELDALLDGLNPLPSEDDFHRNKGALIPPVSASPDHPFGPRQREDSFTENRHTGVTYMIEPGAAVRSVADGTVVRAERLPGFGNTVIVDHGDEYHSIYAHLEEFEQQEGDDIEERDVVGRSGESGSLEGPKLYFELRRQGRPVDPEEWFVSD